MARFILFAAVFAQTIFHFSFFLAELPISFNVVLWDGSTSCAFRLILLFVVSQERHMAELIITCHAQIHTLFFQQLFTALICVLVDGIVFAAIFFGIRIAVVPA